ncbi:MAG: CcmD family protein [Bacillota bacterium]
MLYLFLAYAVIWVLIWGYSVSIARRQRHLQMQVETMRRLVDEQREALSAD